MFEYFVLHDSVYLKMFYAVHKGRVPGVYETWEECSKQVLKFSCPRFKKFKTKTDAEYFVSHGSTKKVDGLHYLQTVTLEKYFKLKNKQN